MKMKMFAKFSDIRYAFKSIDCILLVVGLKLTIDTKLLKYLNYMFRTLYVCCTYYTLAMCIKLFIKYNEIFYFVFIMLPLTCISLHHYIFFKLSKLRELIADMINLIGSQTSNSYKANAMITIFSFFSIPASIFSLIVYFFMMTDEERQR